MTGLEAIASGSFGIVLRGVHDLDGQTYIVKQCKRRILSEADLQNRLQEIYALAASRCAGVVRIFDAWVADSNVFIRTEYLSGGTIQNIPRSMWTEDLLWHLVESIGAALHWLHSSLIIHLDVKPENILFRKNPQPTGRPSEDYIFKLGDFGLARPLSDAATDTGERFSGKNDDDGDRRYLSPELMASLNGASTGFGKAADVYALGATLVDLIGGEPQAVREGKLPTSALSKFSKEFQDIVQRMTCKNPSDRADIFTVIVASRNRAISSAATKDEADAIRRHTEDRLATIDRLAAELCDLEKS